MKFLIFSIVIFFAISACYTAPTINVDNLALAEKNFDLLLNLLPLYGGFKINRMINQRSIDLIRQFFEKNTHHYASFRTELSTEGVFLPELNKIKWNAITQADYDLLKAIVGDTTIKQAIEPTYINYLVNYIKSNQELINRLKQVIDDIGITLDLDNIDESRLVQTLANTFVPMIPDFIPTAVTIVIFGKRDLAEELANNVYFY